MMIGIFKPCLNCLPDESKKVYKCIYCSLCIAIKKKHGVFYTLFISHEIVQLNISCLRYFNTSPKAQRCINPVNRKRKEIISHRALDISTDLCILLVWFKIVDSVVDRENFKYRLLYFLLKNKANKIINNLPVSLKQKSLIYIESTKNNVAYDEIIVQTGEIAQLIFECIIDSLDFENQIFKEIEEIGKGYGELIALSDPLLDYFDDIKKGKTTPINEENYFSYYQKFIEKLSFTQQLIIEKSEQRIINRYFKTSFLYASNSVLKKIENVKNDIKKTHANTLYK